MSSLRNPFPRAIPDKLCDRVSDAVLDAFLTEEPNARVACETFATTNRVVVGGEVGLSTKEKTKAMMERVDGIVRDCVRDIGYEQKKFHWDKIKVHNYLHEQSAHIAQGVDRDGAGDQGIMFGYACRETPELMPAPIQYAHAILRRLAEVRKSGAEPTLGPDAKSQLTLRYDDGKPVEVTSIVLSTQHTSKRQTSKVIRGIVEPYIREVLPEGWITKKTEWHVNPTGTFVIGGPDGDAGPDRPQDHRRYLWRGCPAWRRRVFRQGSDQGRPLGRLCRALSGQERGGRRSGRPLHAAGVLCDWRGQAAVDLCRHPSAPAQVEAAAIEKAVMEVMDLTPRGIREHLDLTRPIYARTAAYGHFGRAPEADGGFQLGEDRSGRGVEKGGLTGTGLRPQGALSPLSPALPRSAVTAAPLRVPLFSLREEENGNRRTTAKRLGHGHGRDDGDGLSDVLALVDRGVWALPSPMSGPRKGWPVWNAPRARR